MATNEYQLRIEALKLAVEWCRTHPTYNVRMEDMTNFLMSFILNGKFTTPEAWLPKPEESKS